MRTRPKPSVVIFAKDVARLAQFYAALADLAVVHTDDSHVVLDQDDYQLVVHRIPQQIAAQIRIAVPPQLREDTPIKHCLPVASIDAARDAAQQFGGQVNAKAREWAARGFRACDGHDPEGNVFQVRESAD